MVHTGVELALLADVSEIGASPLLRAMGSEIVDMDTLAGLVSVAAYATSLD